MHLRIVAAVIASASLYGCVTTPVTAPREACGPGQYCTCGPITYGFDGKPRVSNERPVTNSAGEWYCPSGAYVYNNDSYNND
jgi:hypothetical protein